MLVIFNTKKYNMELFIRKNYSPEFRKTNGVKNLRIFKKYKQVT